MAEKKKRMDAMGQLADLRDSGFKLDYGSWIDSQTPDAVEPTQKPTPIKEPSIFNKFTNFLSGIGENVGNTVDNFISPKPPDFPQIQSMPDSQSHPDNMKSFTEPTIPVPEKRNVFDDFVSGKGFDFGVKQPARNLWAPQSIEEITKTKPIANAPDLGPFSQDRIERYFHEQKPSIIDSLTIPNKTIFDPKNISWTDKALTDPYGIGSSLEETEIKYNKTKLKELTGPTLWEQLVSPPKVSDLLNMRSKKYLSELINPYIDYMDDVSVKKITNLMSQDKNDDVSKYFLSIQSDLDKKRLNDTGEVERNISTGIGQANQLIRDAIVGIVRDPTIGKIPVINDVRKSLDTIPVVKEKLDKFVEDNSLTSKNLNTYVQMVGNKNYDEAAAPRMYEAKANEFRGSASKFWGDITTTIIAMTPILASGAVAGPVGVVGILGSSSKVAGSRQAMEEGVTDKNKIETYGILHSIFETVPEMVSLHYITKIPGLKILKKEITNALIKDGSKKLVVNITEKILKAGFVEGGSEMVTNAGQQLSRKYVYKPDAEFNWGELGYAGLLGAVTGVAIGGPSSVVNAMNEKNVAKQYTEYMQTDYQPTLVLAHSLPTNSESMVMAEKLIEKDSKGNVAFEDVENFKKIVNNDISARFGITATVPVTNEDLRALFTLPTSFEPTERSTPMQQASLMAQNASSEPIVNQEQQITQQESVAQPEWQRFDFQQEIQPAEIQQSPQIETIYQNYDMNTLPSNKETLTRINNEMNVAVQNKEPIDLNMKSEVLNKLSEINKTESVEPLKTININTTRPENKVPNDSTTSGINVGDKFTINNQEVEVTKVVDKAARILKPDGTRGVVSVDTLLKTRTQTTEQPAQNNSDTAIENIEAKLPEPKKDGSLNHSAYLDIVQKAHDEVKATGASVYNEINKFSILRGFIELAQKRNVSKYDEKIKKDTTEYLKLIDQINHPELHPVKREVPTERKTKTAQQGYEDQPSSFYNKMSQERKQQQWDELSSNEQSRLIRDAIEQHYNDEVKKEESIDDAVSAIQDVKKTEDGLKSYRVIGKNFSEEFIQSGKVSLVGNTFESTADLVVLAQIYRDPRFETFRIIYTKGNKIVGTEAMTSRIPNSAVAFMNGSENSVKKSKSKMVRFGADGYYLLHNHPSKDTTPSNSDINVTREYSKRMKGFKGHVIIDTNQYGLISPNAGSKGNIKLEMKDNPIYNVSTPHPLLERMVGNDEELASLAKNVQMDKNISVAFLFDSTNKIKGIVEIHDSIAKSDTFRNFLRKQAIHNGGASISIVGNETIREQVKALVKSGNIRDGFIIGDERTIASQVFIKEEKGWIGKDDSKGKYVNPVKPVEKKLEPAQTNQKETIPMLEGSKLRLQYHTNATRMSVEELEKYKEFVNQELNTNLKGMLSHDFDNFIKDRDNIDIYIKLAKERAESNRIKLENEERQNQKLEKEKKKTEASKPVEKFKKGKWNIATGQGEKEVDGFAYKGLGLRKDIALFVVDHLQSGFKIFSFKTKTGAMEASKYLADNADMNVDAKIVKKEYMDIVNKAKEIGNEIDKNKGKKTDTEPKQEVKKESPKDQEAPITDFGEKIGGARKDLFAEKRMTVEDLEKFTDREADKLVTKDAIWEKMDYEKMVEDGMQPHVVYLVKKMRDSLPAKVQPTTSEETNKKNRTDYIKFIEIARDVISKVKKESDLKNVFYDIFVQNGYYSEGKNTWSSNLTPSIENKFIKSTQNTVWNISKALREVGKTGFPAKVETWKKGISVTQFTSGDWGITKGTHLLGADFKTKEDAENHLETVIKPQLIKKGEGKQEPVIPQLARISREGEDYRKGKDVLSDDFLSVFGFRGGEFGNWTSQAERQASLNYAYDGLMDLANMLGISPKEISLNGQLGIAFGARGTGGKNAALAHYEPTSIVINLTKMKGAGSLAHEWFHAVDDFLGRKSEIASIKNPFLSENYLSKSKLPEEVNKAFEHLVHVINYTPRTRQNLIDGGNERINITSKRITRLFEPILTRLSMETKSYEYNRKTKNRDELSRRAATEGELKKFNQYLNDITSGVSTTENLEKFSTLYESVKGEKLDKEILDDANMYISSVEHSKEQIAKLENGGEVSGEKRSNYYEGSSKIDETRSKPYWATTLEMLARAFSSYAEDTLPGRSDYLNHSANNSEYAEHKPYPEGEERIKINKAFDSLFKELTSNGIFKESKTSKDIVKEIESTYDITRDENTDEMKRNKIIIPETESKFKNMKEKELPDTIDELESTVKEMESEYKSTGIKINLQQFAEKKLSALKRMEALKKEKDNLLKELGQLNRDNDWMQGAKVSQKILDIDKQLFDVKIEVGEEVPGALNYIKIIDRMKENFKSSTQKTRYVDTWKALIARKENADILKTRLSDQKLSYEQRIEKLRNESKLKLATQKYTMKEAENIRLAKSERLKNWKENLKHRDNLIKAERNKIYKNFKRIVSDSKEFRPGYRDLVIEITKDLDLTTKTKKSQAKHERLESLRDFFINNPDVTANKSLMKKLLVLDKKTVSEFTIEELRDLNDTLNTIANLNEMENTIVFGRDLERANKVETEALKRLEISGKQLFRDDLNIFDQEYVSEQTKRKVSDVTKAIFTTDSYNPELLTELLDELEGGIIYQTLYMGPNKGRSKELKYKQTAGDYFRAEIKALDIPIEKWSGSFTKKNKNINYVETDLEGGGRIKITIGQRIALYLHSKNEKSMDHIINGGITTSKDIGHEAIKLSRKDVDKILSGMSEKEIKFGDVVAFYYDKMSKKEINEASLDLVGFEIALEKFYFPLETTSRFTDKDPLSAKINVTKNMQNVLENYGFTKKRTGAKNAIILRDVFEVVQNSIEETASFVGMARPVRDASVLLGSSKFKSKVISRHGINYLHALQNYMKNIDGSRDLDIQKPIEQFVRKGISNTDKAILSVNQWVIMKQFISHPTALVEINGKYLLGGIKANKKGTFDKMKKWSPELRDRFESSVQAATGEISEVNKSTEFFLAKNLDWTEKGTAGISYADRIIAEGLWESAELETKALHPELQGDEFYQFVADRTELLMRRTNSVFELKDRSAIGASQNLVLTILRRFTSQRNVMYNGIRRSFLRYKITGNKRKFLKDILIFTVMQSLLLSLVDMIKNAIMGNDQDKPEDWLAAIITDTASLPYGVGEVMSMANSMEYTGGRMEVGAPSIKAFGGLGKAVIWDLRNAIDQVKTGEEYQANNIAKGISVGDTKWQGTMVTALEGIVDNGTQIAGLPWIAPKRFIKGRFFKEGETEAAFYSETKSTLNKEYKSSLDYVKEQRKLKQPIDIDRITDPVLKYTQENFEAQKKNPKYEPSEKVPVNWNGLFDQLGGVISTRNSYIKKIEDPVKKESKKAEFKTKTEKDIEMLNKAYKEKDISILTKYRERNK